MPAKKNSKNPSAPVVLNIAGIACSFEFPRSFIGYIKRRYSGFLFSGTPEYIFKCKLINSAQEVLGKSLSVHVKKDVLCITRKDFNGQINLLKKQGYLELCANIYSFDSLLRVIYSSIIVREGGFLLHAAGLSINKKGYVFAGISGSGKSTLAKLCNKLNVLTDEIIIVKHSGKLFYACGTPFWGKLKGSGKNISVPLKRFFFLKKGKELHVDIIDINNALYRFLKCVMLFEQDPFPTDKLLKTFDLLTVKHKLEELTFPKSKSLPELIKRL